jgi:DNA-binding CsgD family transcriptional regulator
VKISRRSRSANKVTSAHASSRREIYFFYEKRTGVSHFHLEGNREGQFPVEEAAALLAMHCMVRGQTPADYVVMVEAAHVALTSLAEKAENLLKAGFSVPRSEVRLTRREQEVLGAVIRSLANKEIAALLNLSERTVKFHVSSLLAKFKVRGRMELVFKAGAHSSTSMIPEPFATREAREYREAAPSYHNAPRVGLIALDKRSDCASLTSAPKTMLAHEQALHRSN